MSAVTVGARYQIVIPVKERNRIGLRPGQKVEVSVEGDRLIIEPLGSVKAKGILKDAGAKADATDYIKKLRREWEERQ